MHAKRPERRRSAPVVEGRLLQPRTSMQRRSYEVVVAQHLAGDLRVARLVCASQTKISQPIEEEQQGKSDNGRHLNDQNAQIGCAALGHYLFTELRQLLPAYAREVERRCGVH